LGNGLNLNLQQNGGVSGSGIVGNAIWGNSGVGVDVSGNTPSVLRISGNDIYQNTNFELRNDSGTAIVATNVYWGEPTTSEFNAGQVNLSRIYDWRDNSSVGQVLVQSIRTSTTQSTLRFVQQPQSVTANLGDTVTLSAVVAGVAPITYRWFDMGLGRPQGTNLSLTLSGVTVGNAGGYFLVISNASGVVTSAVAFVAVIVPPGAPTITQQPQSQSVLAGATVSFTVVAAGTGPFGYQWQKDGFAINGAIAPTFTIAAVTVNAAGAYTVVVTNTGGSTLSQAATLTVSVVSGSVINRSISTNGGGFAVSLVIAPPLGTSGYVVEEVLPAGFTPSSVSSGGIWEASNHTITWGAYWDGLARSFTYALVPPAGFSGTCTLTGQALLIGATATTGGDSTVVIGPPALRPTLALVKVAPGLFGVSVAGAVGQMYRIDAIENLGSGVWTPLVTISLNQSPFTFVDLNSTTKARRFYRIAVLQ
jgi:hypothetical protein